MNQRGSPSVTALMHGRSRTMRWRSLVGVLSEAVRSISGYAVSSPHVLRLWPLSREVHEDDCLFHVGASRDYFLPCARTTPLPTALRTPQLLSSSSMRLQNLFHKVSNGPGVLTWNVCKNGQAVSFHTICEMMMGDWGTGDLPDIMGLGQLSLR